MKVGKIRVRWRSVLLGTSVGALILVCGSAAGAGLMAKGAAALEHLDLFAAGTLALAALVGCLTALLGGGGATDSALTALGLLVVLFGLNGALNGWEMESLPVTVLVLAGGCGGALLLSIGRTGGRKPKRRRRKNR